MKPISCNPEMEDTERFLCPGAPQGPALYQGDISKLSTMLQGIAFFGFCSVHGKLISQSKEEMENFIQAKFEDYTLGGVSQKALRTVLPVRS